MKSNWPKSLVLMLNHEGGYVNHPKDPGGSTMNGVTQRTYDTYRARRDKVKQSVKYIGAAEINIVYRTMYWNPIRADDLPIGIDYLTFDASVNSGPNRGPKWTQKALGVKADGVVGPQTIAAADSLSDGQVVAAIKKATGYRLGFLKGLSHWKTFGRGWSRRVSEVEAAAIGMHVGSGILREEAAISTKQVRAEGVSSIGGAAGTSAALSQISPWALGIGLVVLAVIGVIVAKRVVSGYDRAEMMNKVADLLDKED